MRYLDVKWNKKKSVADFVRQRVGAHQPSTDRRLRRVAMAMAWAMGQQRKVWHPDYNDLIDVAEEFNEYRERIEQDLLGPNIETVASRMLHTKPIWHVRQTSDSAEDYHVSRVRTLWLRYVWYESDMALIQLRAEMWRLVDGNAVFKVWWDDNATGEKLSLSADDVTELMGSLQPQEQLVLDRQLQRAGRTEQGDLEIELGNGKPVIDLVPSTRLILPECNTFNEAPWKAERRLLGVQQLIDRYGNKVKRHIDKGRDDEDQLTALEAEFDEFGSDQVDQEDDMVLTIELEHSPSRRLKDGRYMVMVGDEPVEFGRLPDPLLDSAYTLMSYGMPLKGPFYPTSSTIKAMPTQAAYNELLNAVAQGAMLAAEQKVWTQDEELDDEDFLPGRHLIYSAIEPRPLQFGTIDQAVELRLQSYEDKINHIYGAHQISHAKPPGGVTSGTALRTLESQDERRMMIAAELANQGYAAVGRKVLQLAEERLIEPELISLTGDPDSTEAVFVTRDLLKSRKPGGSSHHVVVTNFSRAALTPEMQRVRLLELAQLGFLDPQQHRDEILEGESLTATDRLLQDSAEDKAVAAQENNSFAQMDDQAALMVIQLLTGLIQGQPVSPDIVAQHTPYMVHLSHSPIIHTRIHNQFCRGPRYREQISWVARHAMDLHIELHRVLGLRDMAHTQAVGQREAQAELVRVGVQPPPEQIAAQAQQQGLLMGQQQTLLALSQAAGQRPAKRAG